MGGGVALPFQGPFWNSFYRKPRSSRCRRSARTHNSSPGSSHGWAFPTTAALTAASLALAGDTAAQLRSRYVAAKKALKDTQSSQSANQEQNVVVQSLVEHDWPRALRMITYGFFLYGPGSYAWYEILDKVLPKKNLTNFVIKVILNQIILGPCVVVAVFGWNSLWQGKLKELPRKYKNDALPTLVNGWKFWIPATMVNFGVVPLQTRVAFMSSCAIFWNFYLSTAMVKA